MCVDPVQGLRSQAVPIECRLHPQSRCPGQTPDERTVIGKRKRKHQSDGYRSFGQGGYDQGLAILSPMPQCPIGTEARDEGQATESRQELADAIMTRRMRQRPQDEPEQPMAEGEACEPIV